MDQIVCPNCKQTIPLTEALSHDIQEKFHNQAVEYTKKKDAEYKQKLEEQLAKFEEDKKNTRKELEAETRKKIEEEMKLKIEDSISETAEQKKQITELQTQILELTKSLRESRTREDQIKIENEKKLLDEQEKLRVNLQKTLEDQYKYKLLEKEKQLDDTKKALDEAKRKTEQVSQQLQGEVLELELENLLRNECPYDEIRPVGKGIKGGDIIHIVKTNQGKVCGTIIWESKRTKQWSGDWIPKLKDDQRTQKAEVAVIISEVVPDGIKIFGYKDGVWIGNFSSIVGLVHALRRSLLEIAMVKSAQDGKTGKMEVLYNYIYGTEFRQRIEAIMEAFTSLQESMEKEKRWFAAKWAKDEKSIRRVLDNTMGMSGDLQSITGKELADMDELELLTDGGSDDSIQEELL